MRFALCFFLLLPFCAAAENPHWIWHDNHGKAIQTNETRFFRKAFRVARRLQKATLSVAADDDATVYINGKKVAEVSGYDKPVYQDITDDINRGENVIAIRGHNTTSDVAGVLVMLELKESSR